MNIFKRPMFYAASICAIAASVSLYTKTLSFVIIVVALLALFTVIYFKKYKYITVAIVVALFASSLYVQLAKIDRVSKLHNKEISGEFLVVSDPDVYEDFNKVTLKALKCDDLPRDSKYIVFDYKIEKIQMGDIVKADIKLSKIDLYDEYSLLNYSNGVYATAKSLKIAKTNLKNPFYKVAGSIRRYANKTVSTNLKGDSAGLLLALTTGDKSLLGEKFLEKVKTTGISHVIVVSGMHLSIVMLAVFWCIDKLFYSRYIRSLLSIVFVVFVFSVSGFTTSITRAGTMFIVASMAPIFNRDNDSLNSLFTAVAIMLIIAPLSIFNVSLQLSVLSTLAIIWIVPFYYRIITERFNVKSKVLKSIIGVFLCSICSVIFTLPVTVRTFGFVSIVSPITNLLITYPVSLALVLSVISLAIISLPIVNFFGRLTLFAAKWCAEFTVFTVNKIAKLPITVAVLPKSAFWWSVLLIIVVIAYMYFYEYKRKRSDLNANSIRRRIA